MNIKVVSLGILVYLVFSVGCTHDNSLSRTLYEQADAINGGKMYDEFWAQETGFDQEDNNIDVFKYKPEFFQCNHCHGWDGLGRNGSSIDKNPTASRPNVADVSLYQIAQEKTSDELFDLINSSTNRRDIDYDLLSYNPINNNEEGDKMPNYSQLLTDRQIWDLVKFLKEGMMDVSQLYDAQYDGSYPTGTVTYSNMGLNGDAGIGNSFYSDNCAECHGADGLYIGLDEKGLGGFARANPNIVHHKAKFGELNSDPQMNGANDITQEEMRDLYKALADETNFPTDLPGTMSFARDIQPIFTAKCITCHSGVSPPAGLDLSEGNAYDHINNATYINLASPAQSLIYLVPQAHFAKYTSGESDKVLKWIEQGALNN